MEDEARKTIQQLKCDLDELREEVKKRELNLFRALRVFAIDIEKFIKGETSDFPHASFLGVIGAWLRPRIVLAIGGIFAGLMTFLQLYVILKQNDILDQQTIIQSQQTLATERQAISFILSRIETDNKSEMTEVAIAELAQWGDHGIDVLLRILKLNNEFSLLAVETIDQGLVDVSPQKIPLIIEAFADLADQDSKVFQEQRTDQWRNDLQQKYRLITNVLAKIEHRLNNTDLAKRDDIDSELKAIAKNSISTYTKLTTLLTLDKEQGEQDERVAEIVADLEYFLDAVCYRVRKVDSNSMSELSYLSWSPSRIQHLKRKHVSPIKGRSLDATEFLYGVACGILGENGYIDYDINISPKELEILKSWVVEKNLLKSEPELYHIH